MKMTVEKALRKVERTARETVEWPEPPKWPEKCRVNTHFAYRPSEHQVDALEDLEAALAADPCFEHMKSRAIKEAVEQFANAAFSNRSASHVAEFIAANAEEPSDQICFFPVESLTAHRRVQLGGATLYPRGEITPSDFILQLDPTMDSVIAADCSGTSGRAMMGRAREIAEHGLRLLRVGLRQDLGIIDQQLRFRLGTAYWFTDIGGGWGSRPGEAMSLDLNEDVLKLVTAAPISALPPTGGTVVQQAANRALEWFERAQLATDQLAALLFQFFALEAILDDSSPGLKAERLALRRAVLSHLRGSGFTHPGQTYWLYEKVRSAAVHGEGVPEISERRTVAFAGDVRAAISEFLEFADAHGLAKRSQVLRALDSDPARAEIKDGFLPD